MTTDRLLVIDDDARFLSSMKRYFEISGFDVDAARELEEAEALLSNVRYSAVVTDMCLTGRSGTEGLDVVGFIKERWPWLPVVVLTGKGTPHLMMEAMQLGAAAFLRKPKPLQRIRTVLEDLLARTGPVSAQQPDHPAASLSKPEHASASR